MIIQILLSYVAGLIAVVSPCILPLIPVIFAGSMGSWKRGSLIVLGMISMFTLLGALAGSIPKGGYVDTVAYAGLVTFGLIMISDRFFARYSAFTSSIVGRFKIPADGFLFGSFLGIVWVPCIGPVIGALLAYSAMSSTSLGGAISMFSFGSGVATSIGIILRLSEKRKSIAEFGERIRKASGYIILLYVFLSVSGLLLKIELLLSKIIPV